MKRYVLLLLLALGIPLSVFAQTKKNKLQEKMVIRLALMTNTPQTILPGTMMDIGFQILTENGAMFFTQGFSGGKVGWNEFEIEVKGGTFDNGELIISEVPAELTSNKVELTVRVKSANFYTQQFEIDINYVTDLTISYDSLCPVSPGSMIPLHATALLNNGKTLTTRVAVNSPERLSWSSLYIRANGELVVEGILILSPDPRKYNQNKTIAISAEHAYNKALKKEFSFSLNYKTAYIYKIYAEHGKFGDKGADGQDGTSGQNGGNGTYGQDGDTVEVYLAVEYDKDLGPLLKVEVQNKTKNQTDYYMFNTNGGSLLISVNGGVGGNGGAGGDGGIGGNGGNGGYGGKGGKGGTIIVYVDPGASPYLSLLTLRNQGGDGGRGGVGGYEGATGTTYGKNDYEVHRIYTVKGVQGKPGMPGKPGPAPVFKEQPVTLGW